MVPETAHDDSHGLAYEAYLKAIREPEGRWNLFEIALHIAAVRRPRLHFPALWKQLRGIQSQAAAQLAGDEDPLQVVEKLNGILFDQLGFKGNQENYYDPDNSFMDRILEKRQGIPITLSLLYREVALGLGVQLDCIALPGHFLLSLMVRGNRLFLDVFGAGTLLVEADCRDLLGRLYKGQFPFQPTLLEPATPNQIVLRMLANLKQIYARQGHNDLLVRVLERRIPLLEDPLPEILERGIARLDLQHYRQALSDFELFVESTTDQRMRELISCQIQKLRVLAAGS